MFAGMRGAGVLALLCLSIALLAEAQDGVLRVPLKKRKLDAEQIKATKAALQARNVKTLSNSLLGGPQEADIPLLDFLDAQCTSSAHLTWLLERVHLSFACFIGGLLQHKRPNSSLHLAFDGKHRSCVKLHDRSSNFYFFSLVCVLQYLRVSLFHQRRSQAVRMLCRRLHVFCMFDLSHVSVNYRLW